MKRNCRCLWKNTLLKKNDVTDAKQATYLQHEYFASPMNGDYAAFTNATDAQKFADSLQVSMLQWNNIQ